MPGLGSVLSAALTKLPEQHGDWHVEGPGRRAVVVTPGRADLQFPFLPGVTGRGDASLVCGRGSALLGTTSGSRVEAPRGTVADLAPIRAVTVISTASTSTRSRSRRARTRDLHSGRHVDGQLWASVTPQSAGVDDAPDLLERRQRHDDRCRRLLPTLRAGALHGLRRNLERGSTPSTFLRRVTVEGCSIRVGRGSTGGTGRSGRAWSKPLVQELSAGEPRRLVLVNNAMTPRV